MKYSYALLCCIFLLTISCSKKAPEPAGNVLKNNTTPASYSPALQPPNVGTIPNSIDIYTSNKTELFIMYERGKVLVSDSAYLHTNTSCMYVYFRNTGEPQHEPEGCSGGCIRIFYRYELGVGKQSVTHWSPNSSCEMVHQVGVGNGVGITIDKYSASGVTGSFRYVLWGDTLCGSFNDVPVR